MIARHDTHLDKTDIWSALAAPLPTGVVAWRQDGRAIARDGRWFARFVAYVDANTVRERLDAVVPGEWDLTLDLLPPLPGRDDEEGAPAVAFKARLQILGVIREDVGTGRDYKAAATDAFKRAAVRFGIAHELYAMDANWVAVDGEGRHARALEDPQAAYDRRHARRADRPAPSAPANGAAHDAVPAAPAAVEVAVPVSTARGAADVHAEPSMPAMDADAVRCPNCGGRMWDNRATKRNPKAPDFKCRDRGCDGVIWPPRPGTPGTTDTGRSTPEEAPAPEPFAPAEGGARRKRARAAAAPAPPTAEVTFDASPLGGAAEDDDIPF